MAWVQPHGDHKQLKSIISNALLKIPLVASVIKNKTKITNTLSSKENQISMVCAQKEIFGIAYLFLSLTEYHPLRRTAFCN